MYNTPRDITRITETVSLCRRVANTIRKCYYCDAEQITNGAIILKRGLRERKLKDLDKMTRSMTEIDFNKISICCAYMITFAACHSELTYLAMTILIRTRLDLLTSFGKKLTITSIGGGPGNDLLGAMYAICGIRGRMTELNLNIVDTTIRWQVFFSTLMSEVEANGNCNRLCHFISGVDLSHKFLLGDVTSKEDSGEVRETLEKSDLVLMVKTLSMMTLEKKVQLVKKALELMKRNSILFIVDTEWPSLIAKCVGGGYEKVLDVRDIVACTKFCQVYNCENVTVCVADAIALRKL